MGPQSNRIYKPFFARLSENIASLHNYQSSLEVQVAGTQRCIEALFALDRN